MKNKKEEAFEFIDKFRICKHDRRLVSVQVAKQCALIAVDEIINENLSVLEMLKIYGNNRSIFAVEERINDLQRLKQEIE